MVKSAIHANRDVTHDLHRLVKDLFAQVQDRVKSGSPKPTYFKAPLVDVTGDFDRAPRGAGLAILQNFHVLSGGMFEATFAPFAWP